MHIIVNTQQNANKTRRKPSPITPSSSSNRHTSHITSHLIASNQTGSPRLELDHSTHTNKHDISIHTPRKNQYPKHPKRNNDKRGKKKKNTKSTHLFVLSLYSTR